MKNDKPYLNYAPDNQSGGIPEPPPAELEIRTMESDIKAFKESGGEIPGGSKAVYTPKSRREIQEEQTGGIQVEGYKGPEKGIFAASSGVPQEEAPEQKQEFKNQEQNQESAPAPKPIVAQEISQDEPAQISQAPISSQNSKDSSVWKTILIILVIILAAVALGLLGYYVIFPLIFT